MKGWKIIKPYVLKEQAIEENKENVSVSKVKITKVLLTLADVLRYRGDLNCNNSVLGKIGIGIISETDANLFDLEKGKHTYINPNKACGTCYNCKMGDYDKCLDMLVAGEDYDGFLSDFVAVSTDKLFTLPTSVSDLDALFIEHVALAIAVFEKLNIQKGDYVCVMGGDNFSIILAQLLIYYQAVPILISDDKENYEIAKKSGIYYVLGQKDNWQKEVNLITSGRMTDKIVYVADCDITISKVLPLIARNGSMIYTGVSPKITAFPFAQAIKKQLDILFINNSEGYTASAINIIANKVIDFSHLKLDVSNYEDVCQTLEKMSKNLDEKGKIYETIVNII